MAAATMAARALFLGSDWGRANTSLHSSAVRVAGRDRLSVLPAEEPGTLSAELTEAKPLPATPPVVPVGLSSDLLKRRPDSRRAVAAPAPKCRRPVRGWAWPGPASFPRSRRLEPRPARARRFRGSPWARETSAPLAPPSSCPSFTGGHCALPHGV